MSETKTHPERAESASSSHERALLERLSVAVQAAGLTCWEYSYLEDRFTWFDNLPPGMELRGSEVEAQQRASFGAIFPEDAKAVREQAIAAMIAGQETLISVVRRRDPDGKVRNIRVFQRFFRDSDGKPVRALGTTFDVTAELEAAEKLRQQAKLLREQQERLERASLSMQEGHWELDIGSRRHWASSSYLALLGLPEDSTACDDIDKVTELIHPEEREMTHAATRRHLDGGLPYDVEVRLRTGEGGYRWFRLRGLAQRDAEGRAVSISGSINDIHKQRITEEALREAQARFSRAIHGTQDGLWEIDPGAGRVWLSPRLCELLGYSEGELSDQVGVLRQRAHPDDCEIMDHAVRVAAEDRVPIDLEVRMRTKSGEYRWYRLRGTPVMNESGAVYRISGSMQDVTDARLARDVLVQATEAAEAANRAKSEFLANVSHEIRTPMNGIIGMTRLLLDTALDPTQRDYADTIRTSADSLLTIINDILDFSKIEAGRLHIESLEMDLPGNVEEVGAVMAFQAAAKNLELIVNVQPDVPRHVLGDPQRIRQCLVNLIGNAIKFTHAGEIVCEVAAVGGDGDRTQLRFSVRDTGIGIAPEALNGLFEPFVQADSSTTRHFGGTGLGLSIVRRLVEMMGGKTGVASKFGTGSTFWFTLPMTSVQTDSQDTQLPAANTGRRILIVDDNETNRRVLLTQLTHAGYEVTLASSGREALASMRSAVAAARYFDVILVDFQMPDMDGAMLGEQINADPQLSRARVVLLTSMDRHGDVGRFAAMGFAGYLSKPVRARELVACLEKVLRRDVEDWHAQTHPIITSNLAHEGALAPRLSGKVLLVEDNVVNQKVAKRFLERLGCEVVVAENGAEGVRAFEQDGFRIVLMDLHMPLVDGYSATREIRRREAGRVRTPIVALTANAMSGQLERCLEAGMDALLTKPLNVERLEEVLRQFGLAAGSDQPAVDRGPPGSVPERAPVDLAGFREMCGGDCEFAADLAASYRDSSRELLARLRDCLSAGDRNQLGRVAHQLAGASANVHAAPLRELCLRVERSAADATAEHLRDAVAAIATELTQVCAVLTRTVETGGALNSSDRSA